MKPKRNTHFADREIHFLRMGPLGAERLQKVDYNERQDNASDHSGLKIAVSNI